MSSHGLAAGAVGTAVLNAVTYGDMALTGRAASSAPADTVLAAADRLGLLLRSDGSRPEAYGALAGAATGIGLGLVAAGVRRAGIRLPLLAEAALVGAGAMVATDLPMHVTGVSDVTTWNREDWVRDVVPHLAYGLAVSTTLRRLEPDRPVPLTTRRRGTVLAKGFAIGIATGARSTLGLVNPALATGSTAALLGVGGLAVTEVVMDKLPSTADRIALAPFVARGVLGAAGAVALSRDDELGTFLPALAGAAGAVVGTAGGWAVRTLAARRGLGLPAAVLEDGLALGLAGWASRS